MRRGINLLSIFLIGIVLLNFISAQNATTNNSKNFSLGSTNLDVDKIKEELKNTTQGIFEKEITIPKNLELPARVVFGLKPGDKLDVSLLIILITLLIGFIFVLQPFVLMIPSMEGGRSWIGAVLITLLISLSGAIKSTAYFWLDLGGFFGVLENLGPWKILLSLALIMIIIFGIRFITKIVKESAAINKATSEGFEAGAQVAKLRKMGEIERELTK